MRAISQGISKVEKGLSIILMFSMAIVVFLSVAFRYVFKSPLSWAGEISVFLLIWISFIGGSLGLKYKSQASVTVALEYLPERVRKIVSVTGYVLMILFLFLVLYYSFNWILSPSVSYQKSTTLLIPMWIPYMAVPLGLSFATIHLLSNLIQLLKEGESE